MRKRKIVMSGRSCARCGGWQHLRAVRGRWCPTALPRSQVKRGLEGGRNSSECRSDQSHAPGQQGLHHPLLDETGFFSAGFEKNYFVINLNYCV